MAADPTELRARPRVSVESGERGRRRWVAVAAIGAFSLVGSTLLLLESPNGVHASPDSFVYLGAASNLADGEGWTYPFGETGSPVTLFPPLYPVLLTIPGLLGISTFHWAIWQNALLLIVFSALTGGIVLAATRGAIVPAAFAVLLVQMGTPTVVVYAHIWSETVFYPILLVSLAALARYLTTSRIGWLLLAAAASSVGMLTRYAGLSAFIASCLLLACWPTQRRWDRVVRPVTFAVVALPLNGLWVLRNVVSSGTLTGNNNLVHGLSTADVVDGFTTVRSWFVPSGSVTDWIGLLLVVVSFVLAVSFLAASRVRDGRPSDLGLAQIVTVCLVYAVTHFVFIAVANAFSTRSPPFNDRILGSTFAPLVIAFALLGYAAWGVLPRHLLLRLSLVGVGAALVVLSLFAVGETMQIHYGTERGSLPALRRIQASIDPAISPGSTLLSNRANIAWFLTGRPVRSLPRSCSGGQILPNPAYDQELRELQSELGGAVRQVIFFRVAPRCEPFTMDGLKTALRLERVDPQDRLPVFVLEGPVTQGP